MRSDLSTATLALIASGEVALVQLILFEFPSGAIALNTSNWTLSWGGVDYAGAAGLGAVSPLEDATGEIKGVRAALLNVDATYIALALDESDQVQGAAVTVRSALISKSTYQIVDAPIDWIGECDTMAIDTDGKTATISVSIESGGVDLLRGNLSTTSDADQQALYPGDLAFQFIASQTGQSVVWPAKEYFFK